MKMVQQAQKLMDTSCCLMKALSCGNKIEETNVNRVFGCQPPANCDVPYYS